MSDRRGNLLMWAMLGSGLAVSALALEGRWLLLSLLGVLIGMALPPVLHWLAPISGTANGRAGARQSMPSNMLRWIGAVVAAIGAFLLWKMLWHGDAQNMFEAGHPSIASGSVYVAGLTLGTGLIMLITDLGFVKPDPGDFRR